MYNYDFHFLNSSYELFVSIKVLMFFGNKEKCNGFGNSINKLFYYLFYKPDRFYKHRIKQKSGTASIFMSFVFVQDKLTDVSR